MEKKHIHTHLKKLGNAVNRLENVAPTLTFQTSKNTFVTFHSYLMLQRRLRTEKKWFFSQVCLYESKHFTLAIFVWGVLPWYPAETLREKKMLFPPVLANVFVFFIFSSHAYTKTHTQQRLGRSRTWQGHKNEGRCRRAAEETGHSMLMLLNAGFGFRPVAQSWRALDNNICCFFLLGGGRGGGGGLI